MQIYVKEWPNRAATLYTEAGEELWTFPSLESALALYVDWSFALGERPDCGDICSLHALTGGQAAV
ncbi:MAG: hypothetical protein AB7I42_26855 [Bradyrhizobium sp.]|uniref:hypothetical protein n=1 Tax=Bradyrhizobium sp. TaxID=376 RepID=UPI003D119B12